MSDSIKLYQPVQSLLNKEYGFYNWDCTVPCMPLGAYEEGENSFFEYDNDHGQPVGFTYTGYEEFIIKLLSILHNSCDPWNEGMKYPLEDYMLERIALHEDSSGPYSLIGDKPVIRSTYSTVLSDTGMFTGMRSSVWKGLTYSNFIVPDIGDEYIEYSIKFGEDGIVTSSILDDEDIPF